MAKKPFILPQVLSEQELQKILKETKNKKHKLAFALGFYECMRISEVINLMPEDIDHNMKLIKIKQSKFKKDRNIPIAPEVLKGLKNLPIAREKSQDKGYRGLQKAFKRAVKKALNKNNFSFHSLRHSGVTHYLTKKRWSSLEVQRLAGHSKIATTEIYAHINPQNLVERMWEEV